VAPTSPKPGTTVDFVLDRPFAFNIISASGVSLFAGVVNNPVA
jgi:serine protease inhibitor